jgi:uncharacterized repeat protein (TIGR03803 family)
MEFQLLREFSPITTNYISGLAAGGFYNPTTSGTNPTHYVPFHRIVPGFVIQGGDPTGTGTGGPGFSFADEFSSALIFSATAGQLAMAHSGSGIQFGGALITTATTVQTGTDSMGNPVLSATTVVTGTTSTTATQGTDGSQFFVTLSSDRTDLDFGYTIFGQLLRGYDTLAGIAGTPLVTDTASGIVQTGTDSMGNPILSDTTIITGTTSTPVNPVDITSATVTQNNTDAVLLLSATGLCSGTITVTASSPGGGATSQAFSVIATTDTFNDPPFLEPVPNSTAPNGAAKVTLSGTDLQLDLLRYGYFPVLPAFGQTSESTPSSTEALVYYDFTSGTSPTLDIPLVSNTDNTIAAGLDQWNPTPRGPYNPEQVDTSDNTETAQPGLLTSAGVRIFHIGVGDKPITGALTPIPPMPSGTTGALTVPASASTPLALFISTNPKDTASSFTATVNWGDSHLATGSIVKDGIDRYALLARHTYTTPGEFPIVVDIADPGGARLHLTGTANVSGSASPIALAGNEIFHTGATLTNVLVATLSGASALNPTAYTAQINWGDGVLTPGDIVTAPHGALRILGSHTYQYPQTYTVSTTVTGASGVIASAWAEAHITGFTAPQVFPPFPQAHLAQVWSQIVTSSNAIDTGGANSGGNPYAGVITGTDGNLYGATVNGGANRFGTAYQLTTTGSLNTLYSFTGGNDGAFPYAAVVQGTDGNFYGTTETDGSNGAGTVYQLSASGTFNPLYSFSGGDDGGNPYAGLVTGTDGLFYGTTSQGGVNAGNTAFGTIFTISSTGSFNTIASFNSNADGATPHAPLLLGADGNFYGAAIAGGANGDGTIFSVTPGGSFNWVHSMNGGTDGAAPYAALIQGTNGAFYGTAETDGSNGHGTVFEVTASGTVATLTTLYSFTGDADGGNPYSALTAGTDGLLYGATSAGGAYGFGTIFSITTSGSFNTLYSFTGGNDGADPHGTLLSGTGGAFYGTAVNGGSGGFGTVYQFSPPATVDALYAFTSGTTFQIALDFSVAIVNSGTLPIYNPTHTKYPATFSVYISSGEPPILGQQFSQNGQSVFNIPELQPGQNVIFNFHQFGSTDNRLTLPLGVSPDTLSVTSTSSVIVNGSVTGVVNYHDPVGDYDGSAKTYSPESF